MASIDMAVLSDLGLQLAAWEEQYVSLAGDGKRDQAGGRGLAAIKAEVIDPDTVTTSMFGIRPKIRARRAAKAAARNLALGFKTSAPV